MSTNELKRTSDSCGHCGEQSLDSQHRCEDRGLSFAARVPHPPDRGQKSSSRVEHPASRRQAEVQKQGRVAGRGGLLPSAQAPACTEGTMVSQRSSSSWNG